MTVRDDVNAILGMIATGTPLPAVLEALCHAVERRIVGAVCSILLVDESGRRLTHGAAPGLPAAYTQEIDGMAIGPSAGACPTAVWRNEPVVAADIATDPLWSEVRQLALAHGLRACCCTPIAGEHGVVGTFAVYHREPHVPDPAALTTLEAVSRVAAIAIDRERREETRRQADERSRLLFETGPHPMWVYDIETLRFLAVNQAAVEHYGYSRDEFLAMTARDIRPSEDVPLLMRWAAVNSALLAGPVLSRHRRKDGTLIDVEISRHDIRFEGRPARLVLATDVTERKRAVEALQRRIAEASSMLEVGRAISASLNLQSVLDLIVDRACLLLGAERSSVAVVAPEGSGFVVRFVARRGLSERFLEELRPRHWHDGTTATAIFERRPVWTADILNDPDVQLTPATQAVVEAEGYRAVASVPLLAGNEVLGALVIYRDRPGPFSPDEIDLLQAFAAQAAVAFGNARLYEEAERRRREAEVLAEVARTINASLDLDTVLDRVVHAARELCASDLAQIALPEPGTAAMTFRNSAGARSERYRSLRIEPGEGSGGLVLETGRPLRIADYPRDSRLSERERPGIVEEGTVAQMVVPIPSDERVVGLLYVENRSPRPFTDRDEAVMQRLADHAAIAIANARLFAESEQRRQEAQSLAELARFISQSLEPKEVAQRVAESVCRLSGARRSALYRVIPQTEDLELFAGAGELVNPEVVPRGTAAVGLAVGDRAPVATPDAINDPRIIVTPVVRERMQGSPFRAVLAVPVAIGGRVIGALAVVDRLGRVFGADEIRLVQSFADQAALALENARLYAEVQAQLRQLEETQAQLLQAGKLGALGQLVSGVAHELNNPLAVIVGNAQLTTMKSQDPVVKDRAGKILASAQRAARIIRELQTFARPKPRALSVLDLPVVVERALALREQTLHVSGITVERHVDRDAPPVLGDVNQLEQVVLNLLLNAEQASRAGTGDRITIRIEARNGHARLVISDRGPGIPADVLPRIFEPFFTTKPVGQGTGLGLSICYSIVEAHGGRIWAETAPGQGATFIVELPAHAGVATATGAPDAELPLARPGHILVIDDEDDVAQTLRVLLESLGHRVAVASGGGAGWARLGAPGAAYDLVTLDLKMPDLGGREIWKRLVDARSPFADRVIFVTGDTADPDTQAFLREAGRAVLTKPFDLTELATLVAEHLPAR